MAASEAVGGDSVIQAAAAALGYTSGLAGIAPPRDAVAALLTLARRSGDDPDVVTTALDAGVHVGQASRGRPTARDEVWGERIALTGILPPPPMPDRLIPAPLRPWVVDVAARACLPLEMVAVPAMVSLGAIVGRHAVVRPEPQSAWTTPPNLWGAIVAPSGVMKSHAISAGTRFVREIERAAIAEAMDVRARGEVRAKILKNQIARLEKTRDPDIDMLMSMSDELSSLQPQIPRITTNDPTAEKLGELFAENPRGIMLVRDELAGWLASMTRAGSEGARAFYLEAWSGDSSYVFDRIGRGSVMIDALCLSVIGGIQPGKLASLVDGAIAGGDGDDGLLQRLQLLVWPAKMPDWQRADGEPDEWAARMAGSVYSGLDEMFARRVEEPFRFDDDAQSVYDEYRDEIESRVRGTELARAHAYASHIGKYRGLAPSIALLTWLADGGRPGGLIDADHARLGVDWCRYLETHARRLYAAEIDPGHGPATALAARIQDGSVPHLTPVREIARRHWSGLGRPEQVSAAIDHLETLGWVRRESRSAGGRPSVVLAIHPDLRR